MKILLAGLPGSGKSTQAKLLTEKLGLCLISSGDEMRRIAQVEDELGKKVRGIVHSGGLVDDEIVSEVIRKRVNDPECKNGFVMEGYPRTLEQLKHYDPGFDKVMFIKISEDGAVRRLRSRRRIDDKEEVIRHRFSIQKEELSSLLDHFRKTTSILEVDGDQGIDKVCTQIRELLK